MAEITAIEVRAYLKKIEGRTIDLSSLRTEFQIDRGTKSWDAIRNILYQLAEGDNRVVKPSGKKDGTYKVIKRVERVDVFGVERERKAPIELIFPRDQDTGMELPFAENIVLRQGDLVLIPGLSNYGKTTLALNFIAENLKQHPVLMGNEYTDENEQPKQRFLNRLDAMDWADWTNGSGKDNFELLPVHEDFEDNIIKDRINVIDWIDIETDFWDIKNISKRLKLAVGDGLVIAVIQKNEGSDTGVGGGMTKYYTDLEILVDRHTDHESRLTIGKVKESKEPVTGRSWAFGIRKQGTQLVHVREVKKCPTCHGFKYIKGKGACDTCYAVGWLDK